MILKNQAKRFRTLKNQFGYASKIFEKELDFEKCQSNQLQKKLHSSTEDSKLEILALQEKLHSSETNMEMLRNQLDDIGRYFEEPLETFNLQDSMEAYSGIVKISKRRPKVREKINSEENVANNCIEATTKEKSDDSYSQTESKKVKVSARILQLRNENMILSQIKNFESLLEGLENFMMQSPLSSTLEIKMSEVSGQKHQDRWSLLLQRSQITLQVFASQVDAGNQEISCLKEEKSMMCKLLEQVKGELESTQKTNSRLTEAGKLAPLQSKLKNEDMMEILTAIKKQKMELQKLSENVQVLEFISRRTSNLQGKNLSSPAGMPLSRNLLREMATFEVELLVNSKVYQQLEVGGNTGGITQATIHYFQIDPQSGEVTFRDASMPGSQSSSMLVELVLLPIDNGNLYESKSGDMLGLCIKVQAVHDRKAREILYNNNVLQTNEVMDAIRGQPIDNFSLWPDLVSSWKWERSSQKGWNLVSIRWRFLLKNIFPELSEPLQTLTICGTSHGSTNSFIKNF